MAEILWSNPEEETKCLMLLAHGAGAPMDTPFMTAMADQLSAGGIRVARFEFDYMAQRRQDGKRRPPPRAESLMGEFAAALAQVASGTDLPIFIGGKSMGGRVAAIFAGSRSNETPPLSGIVCLGYPFHPPAKPQNLRLTPLLELRVPALICQGERDPFGNAGEVPALDLPGRVKVHWLTDGDHDFRPRKKSGATWPENLQATAQAIAHFVKKPLRSDYSAGTISGSLRRP